MYGDFQGRRIHLMYSTQMSQGTDFWEHVMQDLMIYKVDAEYDW